MRGKQVPPAGRGGGEREMERRPTGERVYYVIFGVVYPTLKEALEALQGMR